MKHILVTGASGFIGRHLVTRLLSEEYSLRLLVHHQAFPSKDGIETFQGDLTNSALMKEITIGCDTIFHLAGRVHEINEVKSDEEAYRSINVIGTRNLLDAAVSNGIQRFIFFSSVKSMGEETEGCPDESTPPRPLTAYGRSKLEAENLVLDYGRRYAIHTSCLRLPMVYGEGNKGNLPRMIHAIDRNFFPPLKKSTNYRSMVYVSNVVEAALLVARCSQANGMCYIVSDGVPYTTRDIYEMVLKALGKNVPRWHIPLWVLTTLSWIGDGIGRICSRRFPFDSDTLKKLTGSAWYSSERISKDLSYQPTWTLPQALPKMIDWYRREGL